jgi:GH15 family glucan-1,4-alpha-glucosidase
MTARGHRGEAQRALHRRDAAPPPIDDYALIGNTCTAALVSRDGAVDWWCLPRFDSPACFAALVGGPEHGRWRIGRPARARVTRRYRDGTLILETEFRVGRAAARIVDCMALRNGRTDIVRIVEGYERRRAHGRSSS